MSQPSLYPCGPLTWDSFQVFQISKKTLLYSLLSLCFRKKKRDFENGRKTLLYPSLSHHFRRDRREFKNGRDKRIGERMESLCHVCLDVEIGDKGVEEPIRDDDNIPDGGEPLA